MLATLPVDSPKTFMPRLLALRNFYRTHQSSLHTFVMLASERVLQMFIGLWLASQIARNFDHATFVHWQIAMSLWLVFGTIGNITGERILLPLLCAATPAELPRLWNTALAAKFVSGILTAVPLVLWSLTLPDPEMLPLSLLWGLQLLINMPISLSVHEAYARDDFRTPQIARIIAMLCRFGVILLVLWLKGPVTWLVWGWIIEVLVIGLILCRHWFSQRLFSLHQVDGTLMRTLFGQGAALAVASAASVALSRIDRVTLGTSMPSDVLSQYAAAMTLLEAAFAFAAMLATVVGAKTLFRPEPIDSQQHAGLVVFAGCLALGVSLILQLVAEPLMTTIYGSAYLDSATYMRIAAGLLPLVFMQAILQAPLLIRASKSFHLCKALAAFGIGVAIASWAAHHRLYQWISAGAYFGYLTLMIFDLYELRRRAAELYEAPRRPAGRRSRHTRHSNPVQGRAHRERV
ncbi:MAG: hypothetical protein Q4A16_07760 [Lautropia sp.]|nr:hypothetical protein [Lautropia sp.]